MYKNDKLVLEASSSTIDICTSLVDQCNNIYKLLGNHFKKDFYIWTLFFELNNLGFNYQLCGNKSGCDLYPDIIKIDCTTSESIYLIIKVKSDWHELEKIKEDKLPLCSQSAYYLVVNFGYNEFKYRFI